VLKYLLHFFDLILDTQRDIKTTIALKRIPHHFFVSRTAKFFFSDFKPKKGQTPRPHLSEQMIFLLELFLGKAIKLPSLKRNYFQSFQKELQKVFAQNKSYIGFAPGAGNQKKCWPLDSFIAVAKHVEEEGKNSVFILGPQEKDWYVALKNTLPNALFPLQEYPHFLSNPFYTCAIGFFLEAAVVNDAGVAHLLSLSNVKLISLFGPTKAEKVCPLASNLALLKASDFGGNAMSAIPIASVKSLLKSL
jgi:ADP-heptose:LPS heptosyltransferase